MVPSEFSQPSLIRYHHSLRHLRYCLFLCSFPCVFLIWHLYHSLLRSSPPPYASIICCRHRSLAHQPYRSTLVTADRSMHQPTDRPNQPINQTGFRARAVWRGGGAERTFFSSPLAAKESDIDSDRKREKKEGGRVVSKQAKRAAGEGAGLSRKGAASGSSRSGDYPYAEGLAYLLNPPERALKGVGPKRGQQLAKLGTLSFLLFW